MKQSLLIAGLWLASAGAAAETLTGRVIDRLGRPVAAAEVEVVGAKQKVRTDAEGNFDLEIPGGQVDEIHVDAPGYSHRVIHLHREQRTPLEVVLQNTVMEQIDVIGLPIHASTMESVQPISVVAGDELRNRMASTLGETLKNEVGVHSSYFGPVSSSPVIRGLDGPRVLITQNGLDVSDASRVGPDHAVSVEAATAEQIEILRGPATLFYGTGAIGGVVNVVDERVPQDNETRGAMLLNHNSVADEDEVSASYTAGAGQFAYHLDGFWREGGDYEIPGRADLHPDPDHAQESGVLKNSASKSSGFDLGGSWLLDNGFIGLSFGRLDRLNGVPGHAHRAHEDEPPPDDPDAEETIEESVLLDLTQDRWQLLSELTVDTRWLSAINTRIGYTEYQHAEVHQEAAELEAEPAHAHGDGTLFNSETLQARVDLQHQEFARWHGALSLEYKAQDFRAVGEEAFTPPSETDRFALALVEERHAGNVLWQLGARVERLRLSAEPLALEVHGHEEGEEEGLFEFAPYDFNPYSLSAGLVWDVLPSYKLGLSLTHAQRAPSAAEVFSLGPHIGTRTYEVGALFDVHEESPGVYHIDLAGRAGKERSNNIDLSLRKHEGDLGFVINAFYNEVSDYYYQRDTGLTTEDLFAEEEPVAGEPEEEHAHEEVLPVFVYAQADATFYGLEVELAWQLAESLRWSVWGDSIRGTLDEGGNLPRIPPARLGNQLNLARGPWQAELSLVRYFDQEKTATFESRTDGYTLLDARVSYTFEHAGADWTVFLKGSNLTDAEARVHSSFLKELAPLPGRGFSFGVRASF